jgi:lipopolysaccharide biosynthesis regulator YciM
MKRDTKSSGSRRDDPNKAAAEKNKAAAEKLKTALAAAQAEPANPAAWEEAESLASQQQKPDDMAALYRKLLKPGLDRELATTLGQRALRFFEEWYAGETDRAVELLRQVLAADPEADWALERITILLSVQQRWEEVLATYDQALSGASEGARRHRLLQEAAAVATDSGATERAIGYLQALFNTTPAASEIASALEQLLERQGLWQALADMLRIRLPLLPGNEADEARLRLATLCVDKLGQPEQALDEVERILANNRIADDGEVCAVADRVLTTPAFPQTVRWRALDILRTRHTQKNRPDRLVAALRAALGFAEATEKRALVREVADHLYQQGDLPAAREQMVEMLALEPDEPALRVRLKYLAEVTNAPEAYRRGLLAAAGATLDANVRVAHWLEAAQIGDETVSDARALYRKVVEDEAAQPAQVLAALRKLTQLLQGEEDAAELLDVMERQAALETAPGARRALLGEAARLATQRGEAERAIRLWETRLRDNPNDRQALDGLVDRLTSAERWADLVAVLRRRVGADMPAAQRRADLMQLARVQNLNLGQPAEAIATLQEVLQSWADDPEATDGLLDLFAQVEHWPDFLALGSKAGEKEKAHLVALFVRLADLCRTKLGDGPAATSWYAHALDADPNSAGARDGLAALLADAACRPAVVEALARAYQIGGDWAALLSLLPHRLALAADDRARARFLAEAAQLAETRAGLAEEALPHLCAALRLAPDDGHLETEIVRLAGALLEWPLVTESLGAAAASLAPSLARTVHLRLLQARLLEEKLADKKGALVAYQAALKGAPDNRQARAAVIRLAADTGAYELAADTALGEPFSPDRLLAEHLPIAERIVAASPNAGAGFSALGTALSAALARRSSLPGPFARTIEERIAGYAVADSEGWAEAALLRAAAYDPMNLPTLRRLAQEQRSRGGRPLLDTLMRISALAPRDLAVMAEAADVAGRVLRDTEVARRCLTVLYDRAVQLLRLASPAEGQLAPAAAVLLAVDGLTSPLLASKAEADLRQAVDLLLDASRLPLSKDDSKALRARAGQIAIDVDKAVARDVYRRIVDDEPDNREAMAVLARLYEQAEQLSELLALRCRQLDLLSDGEARLALRLEIARVGEVVEGRTGRFEVLLANLEELPGHPATLAALSTLLRARGRCGELADIFSAQARKLEGMGDSARAARLWTEVAALAESPLGDSARAIAAWERVVALENSSVALDSLARLCVASGEPLLAAQWLEQRMSLGNPAERRQSAAQLARAYVAAGQHHRALASLEGALAEDPTADELWVLLTELYRDGERWEALVRALTDRCAQLVSPEAVVACARETLAVCQEHLHSPERAVPVLEKALALAPADRSLRLALADGLRRAGRLPDARVVLQGVLEEYGRRQSRERAALHHQIAQVARAEKNPKLALQHLEQASSVLLDNMEVQLALAEVAEEVGEYDRAEKAYRALVVLARRGQPADTAITAGEVLLRLRRVALALGRKEAAAQSLDSALARALHDPAEARHVQAALLAAGDGEIVLGLLEKRRAAANLAADEAAVVCELAEVLEKLGRGDEALEVLLKTVEKVPENATAHTQARALAAKLGQAGRYLDAVTKAADQLRRANDAPRLADLLLRAGEVSEQDLRDVARATAFYHRVEQTGQRVAEALTGLARVSLKVGDQAEQRRAAAQLRRMSQLASNHAEKADLLFRVAECQFGLQGPGNEGLDALAEAVDLSPDLTRAMALVEAAHVPEAELARVMPVYEKVARASSDEHVLLDFYERRAALPGARSEDVRDGVELAVSLGGGARAEKLLERAVALARGVPGGLRDAIWAILDLVRRLRGRGDFTGVTRILEDTREAWPNPRLAPVVREMARAAAEHSESAPAAARLFEHLRTLHPLDREVWEPLLHLYAGLGNQAALESLVRELVEKLMARSDRNAARMAWAKFLMGDSKTEDAAATVLREILAEEPGHPEGLMLLADLHERRGEMSRAVAILSEALAGGEGAATGAGRVSLAQRFGDLAKKIDPSEAKKVYRQVLAAPIPDAAARRSLQLSLLDLLSGKDELAERAALSEEILAGESEAEAAARALDLAEMRTHLHDDAGTRRALELGRSRCPDSADLFRCLSTYYSDRELWPELVELLSREAARVGEVGKASSLLHRAAHIQRDKLRDEAGAARSLRQAMEAAPGDIETLRELTASLASSGDMAAARSVVTDALAGSTQEMRADLLRLRAELVAAGGDEAAAVADMEEALTLGAQDLVEPLSQSLAHIAERATAAGDLQAARAATLRLAELVRSHGDEAQSDQILFRWIDANPTDREVLQVMRIRFEAAERWEAAVSVWSRLAHVEEGEAKAEAVLAMANACEKIGRGADAIPWLKDALHQLPGQAKLLARLAQLLQASGDTIEAAELQIHMAEGEADEGERYRLLIRAAGALLVGGAFPAAVQALEKASPLRPAERAARTLLIDAYIGMGDLERGSDVLAELLVESKTMRAEELAVLYQRQARLAAAKGDSEGQLYALKKALDTDRKSVAIATEVADLAEAAGDDELAMRALRVVTANPIKDAKACAVAYLRQARIAHKSHDKARAIIFVKRALQEDPDLAEAKALLDELK